jgi:integrase/recombinase XerD
MAQKIEEKLQSIVRRKNQATDLDSLLQGYRLYARAEGKSPKTIGITSTAISVLRDFLEARGYSTSVTDIGIQELREFILHLQQVKAFQRHRFTRPQDRRLSGHAINCYLRAIRAFWSWLVREEIIRENPFDKVRIPKAPQKIVATFSDSQIRALLGAICASNPVGFRDWTIILALLDTGLRASELTGLTTDDVNLGDGVVRVNGKGSKERIVPVGSSVQRAMWKYLQHYRPQPANPLCRNFFLTRNGVPMSVNRLESVIEKHGRQARIEGVRCSPHTLRHTFAISYLRNGGDVFSLQRILGHSSIDVVRIYVNLATADVKACHQKFSPADHLEMHRNGYTLK